VVRVFPIRVLLLCVLVSGCATSRSTAPLGSVSPTANPQVAQYTVVSPTDATVTIEFGTDTRYGLQTSSHPVFAGGTVNIQVAGMRAFTTYHMRARLDLPNGTHAFDSDRTFTTGGLPPSQLPVVTTTTTAGMTPQPGVEMVNVLGPSLGAVATDLAGNVIWTYQFVGSAADAVTPIKMLSNGHFLVVIGPASNAPLGPSVPDGTITVVREIDLAGNTVREISIDDLNQRLASAGFQLNVAVLHHDVLPLPNGDWIVLTNTVKQFTDLPGYPGVTNVLGDVLIDLDTNLNPVWVWNEFDHLDVNRHPFLFPDWTHTNALIYSTDDGNLIVSIRHQNWLVKVDYRDGAGTGAILWHLGYQGDFSLEGGTDPTDWFYAQHGPSFVTTQTTGKFSLVLFDNGDDRVFPAGVTCAVPPQPSCPYSTVPILAIDETGRIATIKSHLPAPFYSDFAGNAEVLQNGDVEFDETDNPAAQNSSAVYEVNSQGQAIWQMNVSGRFAYRAFRLPSLYPGVQW
jgi:arylsulfate sulfotransferase